MLSLEGRQYMRRQPGLAIYPGVAIGILVFSFNLFGDALRDVLDPRLRGGR
jgi:peptide/nickel transport system permease protein